MRYEFKLIAPFIKVHERIFGTAPWVGNGNYRYLRRFSKWLRLAINLLEDYVERLGAAIMAGLLVATAPLWFPAALLLAWAEYMDYRAWVLGRRCFQCHAPWPYPYVCRTCREWSGRKR